MADLTLGSPRRGSPEEPPVSARAPLGQRRVPVKLSAVPYMPGLDGMRALAVVAVMIYHANSEWLTGGFLGVEVFFVISGYLITLLLMAERENTGRVDLLAFWGRRARRLLPALFLTLFLVLTYTMLFRTSTLGKLRGDLIAAVIYVTNWYQIWVGQGYAAVNDFVPLRHLWSLAVEEQFYLVWPVVMMVLMRRGGTRRLALTARWLIIAALVVTVVVALLYNPGRIGACDLTPTAFWQVGERCIDKADALYLSTITRASGLLIGAAFAMVWRPRAIMRGPLRDRARLLDAAGVLGLLLLVALTWFVHYLTPSGADPWLFRGGFLVTDLATVAVIAAVSHSHTLLSRVLSVRPLLWIGTRSYGMYLYHWPIYQAIRKVAGNSLSVWQFIVAMALTIPLTEFSYRMIEVPVRRRQFAAWWASLRRRRNPLPRQAMAATVVVAALLFGGGIISLGLADLQGNEVEQASAAAENVVVTPEELIAAAQGAAPAPATAPTAPPASSPPTDGVDATSATSTTSTSTTTTTSLPQGRVDFLAIGDSVMEGAATLLTERGYTVIARQSLQMIDMVPVMQQLADNGVFGDPVIIHLGTNGSISAETLDDLLAPLSDVPNVLLFTVRANRSWSAANNAIIRARDHPNDNIKLIDWEVESNNCTGNCFADDGIHLSADGVRFYANLIGDFTGK